MKQKILIIVLICYLRFYVANSQALKKIKKVKSPFHDECGKQTVITRSRIFGGQHAEIGEYPWLVQILHTGENNESIRGCTGFVIHKKFIMTAAHCASKSMQEFYGPIHQVVLGEHDTEKEIDCKRNVDGRDVCAEPPIYANIKPKKTIVHKLYDDSPINHDHHYDIALLQLKKPIKYSNYIKPICLAEETTEEKNFFISGWGRTNVSRSSNIKLKAQIPRSNHDDCVNKYDSRDVNIEESQICAGGISGVDSCNGDSGGPLMVQMNLTWYAEGIVSFGRECGLQGWPGVYTNIPHYINWIKTNIVNRLESDRKAAERKRNKN